MVNRMTPNPEPPDWSALARYLVGEADALEAAAIERWLAENPAERQRLASLERLLEPNRIAPTAAVDVDIAWSSARARIAEPPVHRIETFRRAPFEAGSGRWPGVLRRAAAVVALSIGITALFSMAIRERTGSGLATGLAHVTTAAERDSLVLPDGTQVLLGPGTELIVPVGYGEAERRIELVGEAMFRVAQDERMPFLVHFPGGVAVDLGTVFSVRTAPAGGAKVVVTEGLVRLRRDGATDDSGVVLAEGDRGTLPPVGAPFVERGAVTDDDIAWTRGVLVIRDQPVSEVAVELRRWFGYELRVVDPELADRHLTATFRDERPEEVANVVALALGASVRVSGDTIVIRETDGAR